MSLHSSTKCFVERRNRHIVETIITLLLVASLGRAFWYHACAHAIYLINIMPSKSLHIKSPYSVLYHRQPSLGHLKVFGSAVYPYLRPYNNNKLQARSSVCLFLGYALGYKVVYVTTFLPRGSFYPGIYYMMRHVFLPD